jgi:optic atrophy 3 protein
MHTAEVKLRTNILGEPARLHVKPLSETRYVSRHFVLHIFTSSSPTLRAIENGANALAEGFLFSVAALLILGETWRTSRNQSKRRDDVDDRIEELSTNVASLTQRLERIQESIGDLDAERERTNELARIVERVVEIGLRGGWAEFEDTPLKVPRVQLVQSSSKSSP